MQQNNLPEDFMGESEGGCPITPADMVQTLAELKIQGLIPEDILVNMSDRYIDEGDLKKLPLDVQAIILSVKQGIEL